MNLNAPTRRHSRYISVSRATYLCQSVQDRYRRPRECRRPSQHSWVMASTFRIEVQSGVALYMDSQGQNIDPLDFDFVVEVCKVRMAFCWSRHHLYMSCVHNVTGQGKLESGISLGIQGRLYNTYNTTYSYSACYPNCFELTVSITGL